MGINRKESVLVCDYKEYFSSKGEILDHIKLRKKRGSTSLSSYKCQTCGGYHLTSRAENKVGAISKGRKAKGRRIPSKKQWGKRMAA